MLLYVCLVVCFCTGACGCFLVCLVAYVIVRGDLPFVHGFLFGCLRCSLLLSMLGLFNMCLMAFMCCCLFVYLVVSVFG